MHSAPRQRKQFALGTGTDVAYYIDDEVKKIYLIQSKFRTNEKNFEVKHIDLKEIFKMDADRIAEGKCEDEDGNPYNGKIQKMLEAFKKIPDPARYSWQVILLANIKDAKDPRLAPDNVRGLFFTVWRLPRVTSSGVLIQIH